MSEGVVSYRFLSVVGEGGFGRVYRARMETTDGFLKEVAIKILSDDNPAPSLLRRFRDEARILGQLRDRAIVGVEPPIQIAGRWAVVMEFVDGTSCGSLLGREPIPPGVAVEVVMEIARALHNAYHMPSSDGEPLQLLHRDIKPDNIQVTPAGEVRLLDFGIARANFSAREFHTRQSFGGTPGYIAPERPRGVELPVGDVYSLGVVLHELVIGKRPRYTPTLNLELEVAELAAELDVDPVAASDPHIAETLRLAAKMRAEEPEHRPSARQVEEACRQLRQRLPPPYLRDWAEEHVPHRVELAPDAMVGRVLSHTMSTTMPMALPQALTVTLPVESPTEIVSGVPPLSPPSLSPTQDPSNARLALGAVLGGSAAFLGLIAVTAVVLAVFGVYLVVVRPNDPVAGGARDAVVPAEDADADADADADLAAPPDVAPDGAVDVPPVAPVPRDPGGAAPAPGPAPAPREVPVPVVGVVEVPVQPAPVLTPTPTVEPAPTGPKRPTGTVVVKTIPSGGTVTEAGATLASSGGGEYELTVGRHMLVLVSPSGERSKPIPAIVSRSEKFTVCYNFDTNLACDASAP